MRHLRESDADEVQYDDSLLRERFTTSSGSEIPHTSLCLSEGIAVGQRYSMRAEAPDREMFREELAAMALTVAGFTPNGSVILRMPDGHCAVMGLDIVQGNFVSSDPAVPIYGPSIVAGLFDEIPGPISPGKGREAAFFLELMHEDIFANGEAEATKALQRVGPAFQAVMEGMQGLDGRTALGESFAAYLTSGPSPGQREALNELQRTASGILRRVRAAIERERTQRESAAVAALEDRLMDVIFAFTGTLETVITRLGPES